MVNSGTVDSPRPLKADCWNYKTSACYLSPCFSLCSIPGVYSRSNVGYFGKRVDSRSLPISDCQQPLWNGEGKRITSAHTCLFSDLEAWNQKCQISFFMSICLRNPSWHPTEFSIPIIQGVERWVLTELENIELHPWKSGEVFYFYFHSHSSRFDLGRRLSLKYNAVKSRWF